MPQEQPEDLVMVGRISGLYGVKGWVKVFSYTEPRDNITRYSPWLIKCQQGDWREISLVSGKAHGKGVIVRLQGYDDRDQASQLIGCDIALSRQQLPALAADEYYWNDLMGLTVETTDQQVLGVVDHLLETGSNDVLVIKGDREHLVPYLRDQVVKQIDLQTGKIIVDWDPEF